MRDPRHADNSTLSHTPRDLVEACSWLEELQAELAHAKRELEQSRQREAAAVAKLALVSAWLEGPELTHQSGMDDYYCYADECDLDRLEAILDGEPAVLAVVDVPDGCDEVLVSGTRQGLMVVTRNAAGGRVIVLRDGEESA